MFSPDHNHRDSIDTHLSTVRIHVCDKVKQTCEKTFCAGLLKCLCDSSRDPSVRMWLYTCYLKSTACCSLTQTFSHLVNPDTMLGYIMLLMTPENMTGIHVTLSNLATMTDKMFSSSYITAATDVIALAAADDLLLQSTQSLSSSGCRLRSTGPS